MTCFYCRIRRVSQALGTRRRLVQSVQRAVGAADVQYAVRDRGRSENRTERKNAIQAGDDSLERVVAIETPYIRFAFCVQMRRKIAPRTISRELSGNPA